MSSEDWSYHIYLRSKLLDRNNFYKGGSAKKIFEFLQTEKPTQKSHFEHIYSFSKNFAESIEKDFSLYKKPSDASVTYTIDEILIGSKVFLRQFPNQPEFSESDSINDLFKIFKSHIFGTDTLLSLSLDYSDKEILNQVKQHLKSLRKKSNYISITDDNVKKQLDKLRRFRLLALFDLLYWREINPKKTTLIEIGALVWPTESIGIDQRIRKKGIPLINEVFRREVALRIYGTTDRYKKQDKILPV